MTEALGYLIIMLKLIWTKKEYEAEAETRILATGRVLRGSTILVQKVNAQILTRAKSQRIVRQKNGVVGTYILQQ